MVGIESPAQQVDVRTDEADDPIGLEKDHLGMVVSRRIPLAKMLQESSMRTKVRAPAARTLNAVTDRSNA